MRKLIADPTQKRTELPQNLPQALRNAVLEKNPEIEDPRILKGSSLGRRGEVPSNCCECNGPMAKGPLVAEIMGTRVQWEMICEECTARNSARAAAAVESAIHRERVAKWEKICPPLYQQTDVLRPELNQAALRKVMEWNPACGTGLAIQGPAGTCKTRMAFLRLRELHFNGVTVRAIRAPELNWISTQQFSNDAEEKSNAIAVLRSLKSASVLFIDDLGKERATARLETELWDLLEARASKRMPIIFTTNFSGDEFASRFTAENREDNFHKALMKEQASPREEVPAALLVVEFSHAHAGALQILHARHSGRKAELGDPFLRCAGDVFLRHAAAVMPSRHVVN